MEEVEIPSGLMRTWKVTLLLLICSVATTLGGFGVGRSYARVVEHEVRVEVPYPACRDEMIKVDNNEKNYSCTNPEHVSQLLERRSFGSDTTFLVCTCPHAGVAAAADAGAAPKGLQ